MKNTNGPGVYRHASFIRRQPNVIVVFYGHTKGLNDVALSFQAHLSLSMASF